MTPPKYAGPNRRQRDDEIEVKTALGSVKASGGQVVFIIVIAMAVGALGYQGWIHDASGKERSGNITKQINEMKDAINEQTYILTLSADERQKLRLDMPESLRRKTGR